MNPQALPFISSALLGFIAWGLVTHRYIWPKLKGLSLQNAAEPILYLHLFRYIGLSFIAEGVASSELNPAWSLGAAYGDLIAAILALLVLGFRKTTFFKALLWVFNIVGTADFLRDFILGPIYDVAPHLGATFFIPVFVVPLLFWTHVILFVLLLRNSDKK